MTKQVTDSTEMYEQREKTRRREFIERMEQKLEFKMHVSSRLDKIHRSSAKADFISS
jgi:hypothetical protein